MTFILRAVFSVPGHALFTCMGGYALGLAKFHPEKAGPGFVTNALLLAMLLHGIFNLIATINIFGMIGFVILMSIMWRMLARRVHKALEISPFKRHKYQG